MLTHLLKVPHQHKAEPGHECPVTECPSDRVPVTEAMVKEAEHFEAHTPVPLQYLMAMQTFGKIICDMKLSDTKLRVVRRLGD